MFWRQSVSLQRYGDVKTPTPGFDFEACVTPRVHILPQLVGAGLEPGIPVREAGALTSNAKGYSL